MKSTRTPRRGIPNERVLRSREGQRPKSRSGTDILSDPPSLPTLPPPSKAMVPRLKIPMNQHVTDVHPKLSARLVPNLRGALDRIHEDVSATLTKTELYQLNQEDDQEETSLTPSDIDMLFLCYSRDGVINRHLVTTQLAKMEYDNHYHMREHAPPIHSSKKPKRSSHRSSDIFTEPRFTPNVPVKQSPRSLAW